MWPKVAAVVLGLSVALGIANTAGIALQPLLDTCPNEAPALIGIYPADVFLCFIVPFFEKIFATDDSRLVVANIFPLFGVFNFLQLLEAGRKGARGFITFPTVVLTLGQLLGFGVVSPFLAMFAFPDAGSPRAGRPSAPHAWIALGIALVTLPFMAVISELPAGSGMATLLIALLQLVTFLPLLLMLAPLFNHGGAGSATPVVHLGFSFLAGVSLVTYISSLFQFWVGKGFIPLNNIPALPALVADCWQRLTELQLNLNLCTWALVIDFLGVYGAVVLMVLRDEGFASVLEFLISSVIMSPGAAAAFKLHRRETQIDKMAQGRSP